MTVIERKECEKQERLEENAGGDMKKVEEEVNGCKGKRNAGSEKK